MQPDIDLLDTLQTDLAELTALHAPSGAEQPVIARLRELFSPLVDAVSVDHMGNLVATRERPPGTPHIVVSAHADEIGALVASIEPDGFLCPHLQVLIQTTRGRFFAYRSGGGDLFVW